MLNNLFRNSYKITKSKLFKYALVSNTVFGVCLRGIGDSVQQSIERKKTQTKIDQKPSKKAPISEIKIIENSNQNYDWKRISKN
jgi:hypothetical protein